MATELLGIIATVFVLASFLFKEPIKIRAVNLIGAVLFVIYGVLIGAVSVWLLNAALVGVQIYHINKLNRR